MFLLIDKPKGITSHDVVDEVRKITGERRVGHGGTLDPNATGLLVVGVGRESTKGLSEIAQHTKKTYEAEIFLGETRDTDDVEGKVLSHNIDVIPSDGNVQDVIQSFIGEQMQMPPSYSAIKLRGKKAYELARSGKEVILEPRRVTIYSIELIDYSYPLLKMTVEVSSGTYIRSLARDIGEKLGVGAYLKNLRRTKIGKFSVEQAKTLEELKDSF
jgi:tRNA pseudouridine55 synthase